MLLPDTVSLSVFSILMAEYLVRYVREAPVRPLLLKNNSNETTVTDIYTNRRPMASSLRLLVLGISLTTLFLYVRYAAVRLLSVGLI